MLAEFGDGYSAPCAFCAVELDWHTMTKDRHPVPGRKGGRYVKGNVRPACGRCNSSDGARWAAVERAVAKLDRDRRNARRRELYALRRASGPVRPVDATGAVQRPE